MLMERVDAFFIDRVFQPVVGWIAEHPPLDCFCRPASAQVPVRSFGFSPQAGNVTAAIQSRSAILQILHATLLLLGFGAILVLHRVFQRPGGRGNQANPLRAHLYAHRLTILFSVAINGPKVAFGSGSLLLLAVAAFAAGAVYIGSCSTPPPQRRTNPEINWGWKLSSLPG